MCSVIVSVQSAPVRDVTGLVAVVRDRAGAATRLEMVRTVRGRS